jgi:hypothetical protein
VLHFAYFFVQVFFVQTSWHFFVSSTGDISGW